MPPRRPPSHAKAQPTARVSQGAGMVAGLELWRTGDGCFALKDTTTDGRFTDDVLLWSDGLRPVDLRSKSLNPPRTKKSKNAAQ